MKKLNWKTILQHTGAVVLFLVIALVYSSPIFEGKELLGHDGESWAYSAKEARDHNDTHDEPTLWTNSMFGGMPTYQITMPKNYNLLGTVQDLVQQLPSSVFFVFLYLICFYILMLCFSVPFWLALAGTFAFTFASYNFIIIAAGHATKAVAIAYMAPLVGSVFVAFRRNKYVGAMLTTLFLSLAIRCNHVQILYYTIFLLAFFVASEFFYSIKGKTVKQFFKSFGLLCVALILAVGMNATMLLTTYEYSKYTMRGESNGLTITEAGTQVGLEKDYITRWSYGIPETMTLIIPNFMGGASSGTLSAQSATAQKLHALGVRNIEKTMESFPLPLYWGTQPFTSGPVYFGAILCFLSLLGMFTVRGRKKWWILGAGVLSVALSWGRNFMPLTDFFIDYVPMYNKFRTVSMTLVVTGFCVALLGILGLKNFFSEKLDRKQKLLFLTISGTISMFATLIFALFPSLAGDFIAPSDAQFQGDYTFLRETLPVDRSALLQADAWRSFAFVALALGVLVLSYREILKAKWAYMLFALLFLADMYPICKRYLNNDNFKKVNIENLQKPSLADQFILADKSHYRVLDASVDIFNDASPAYFHKNIGGYHAAKLRRYQELIDVHLANEIQRVMRNVQTESDIVNNLSSANVLNMLNMKYLIYNKEAQPILNPYANGAVWFVDSCVIVPNADEEMMALGVFDLKKELIVNESFASFIPEKQAMDSTARIVLTNYEPNRMKYASASASEQVAVFSEIFYDKGWNAYLDGEKTDYFRANYLLRAIKIPAGKHELEFRFEPKSFSIGNYIAITSSGLFLLLLLGAGAWLLYRKK